MTDVYKKREIWTQKHKHGTIPCADEGRDGNDDAYKAKNAKESPEPLKARGGKKCLP